MSVRTESPIELRLLGALAIAAADRGMPLVIENGSAWAGEREPGAPVAIFTQVPLDGFRLDLVVHGARPVAVECDGHAFHERTKEQAAHDKARDRKITRTLPVLRFTGSEIHRDAMKCAGEVLDFVRGSAAPGPSLRPVVGAVDLDQLIIETLTVRGPLTKLLIAKHARRNKAAVFDAVNRLITDGRIVFGERGRMSVPSRVVTEEPSVAWWSDEEDLKRRLMTLVRRHGRGFHAGSFLAISVQLTRSEPSVELLEAVERAIAILIHEGEIVVDGDYFRHPHDVWRFDPAAVQ